jgi:hypothetical protein
MKRRSRFQGSQDPNSKSYREPTRIAGRPMDLRDPGNRNFNFSGPPLGRPVPPRFTQPVNDRFKVGRPVYHSFEQPGVNFRETLEGKTTKQDKSTVTSDKTKAFGDLLNRMKRF